MNKYIISIIHDDDDDDQHTRLESGKERWMPCFHLKSSHEIQEIQEAVEDDNQRKNDSGKEGKLLFLCLMRQR